MGIRKKSPISITTKCIWVQFNHPHLLAIFFVFHSSHLTIHKQCTMFFLDLNLGLQIAASSHSSLLIVQIDIDDS
jgi:hypothetical protein